MSIISRYFESNQIATQLINITSEQFFDLAPVLDEYVGCVVQIAVDFPPSPTDNLVVSFYARQDGINWDVIPFYQFEISNQADPAKVTVIIRDVYEFRVGVKRSGTTDTIPSANMNARRWRYTTAWTKPNA